jgi:lipopolysaccharide export system protein LptA
MSVPMAVRTCIVAAAIVAALVFGVAPTQAQGPKNQNSNQNSGPPNALQGFSQNKDEPVKIRAASLEVRDKEQQATFAGDVQVLQGDTEMRCKTLVIFYDDDTATGSVKVAKAGDPTATGSRQIRRIDAKGGVTVTQKDQNAIGDTATFDMRANVVTLMGNVVVTRGQDVLRGQRLVVDLTSGVTKMDAGRVEGLFHRAPEKK